MGALVLVLGSFCLALPPGARAQQEKPEDYRGKIVEITGDVHSGQGTVVTMGGKTHIVTTRRVLGGNSKLAIKTADGKELKPARIFLATNSELVFLEVEGMEGLSVMEDLDTAVGGRDEFKALSLENGKVSESRGRLSEWTPVVTAGFFTSKKDGRMSGGPAIHRKTGGLMGLVNEYEEYTMNFTTGGRKQILRKQEVVRLDNVGELVPTTWGKYLGEIKAIGDLTARTNLLKDAGREIIVRQSSVDPRRTPEQRFSSPDNGIQRCIDEYVGSYRPKSSAEVLRQAKVKLHRAFLWATTTDSSNVKPEEFTAYNRTLIEKELGERKDFVAWVEANAEK